MNFCLTFVIGASWDKNELIMFWDRWVKGQGDIIAAEASTTGYCHKVHLFFPIVFSQL